MLSRNWGNDPSVYMKKLGKTMKPSGRAASVAGGG